MRELEEQRARSQPIVSLVDNMVKFGSLYKGPQVRRREGIVNSDGVADKFF